VKKKLKIVGLLVNYFSKLNSIFKKYSPNIVHMAQLRHAVDRDRRSCSMAISSTHQSFQPVERCSSPVCNIYRRCVVSATRQFLECVERHVVDVCGRSVGLWQRSFTRRMLLVTAYDRKCLLEIT